MELLKSLLLLLLLAVLPLSPFVINSGEARRKRVSEELTEAQLLVAPILLTADEFVMAAASSFLLLFALKFCLY